MQGKVEICGVNTSRLHVLSQVEMDALLRRAQAGDEDAREKLIEGNLRLVLSVIQRFDKRGENPDDLFQVGCIGLMKAIANFDPDKQVRFSTYGVPMIAGEVRRYLRDNSAIRVSPLHAGHGLPGAPVQGGADAHASGGSRRWRRSPGELELPLEEVGCAHGRHCARPVSLYEPVYSDGGDPLTVMDQVRDTEEHRRAAGWSTSPCSEAIRAPERPGKAHSVPAVLRREDPDGGGRQLWVSPRRRCPGWKRAPLRAIRKSVSVS